MSLLTLLMILLADRPVAAATEVVQRASSAHAVDVALLPVAGGLDRPLAVRSASDGSSRLYIVEQPGRIRVLADGEMQERPFLDLSNRIGDDRNEQGLLGLAFHPHFDTNRRLFVNYTDLAGNTVVSEFAAVDGRTADPASEAVILTLDQPFANHNAGDLAFGPDGLLWIATGDGGGAGDPRGNAQDPQSLLGKLLRIDVDNGSTYVVPADNPFVQDPAVRDEIWALGLRNPWRFSFDRCTGDLFMADVGQFEWEEVNFEEAADPGGHNYGWNTMEGRHCFQGDSCSREGLTLPVFEYSHATGCSITGGYVYRGLRSSRLRGAYVFADFCSGTIWGLRPMDGNQWRAEELIRTELSISGFGEDENGELYVAALRSGAIYRLVVSDATPQPRRPGRRLTPAP